MNLDDELDEFDGADYDDYDASDECMALSHTQAKWFADQRGEVTADEKGNTQVYRRNTRSSL